MSTYPEPIANVIRLGMRSAEEYTNEILRWEMRRRFFKTERGIRRKGEEIKDERKKLGVLKWKKKTWIIKFSIFYRKVNLF